MKKTKLLMPILGVGAVAATVAPMVAMTGCNKEEVDAWTIESVNVVQDWPGVYHFELKYNKSMKDKIPYTAIDPEIVSPTEGWDISFPTADVNPETKILGGDLTYGTGLIAPTETTKVKIAFTLQIGKPKNEVVTEKYTITITCPVTPV